MNLRGLGTPLLVPQTLKDAHYSANSGVVASLCLLVFWREHKIPHGAVGALSNGPNPESQGHGLRFL